MKRENGFSLLELSVIVLILGMLTVLLLPLAGLRLQQEDKALARTLLEQADWALTGYIMINHRLPCPAPAQDGLESCLPVAETGYLPYRTLGIADARAKRVRYGVLRRTAGVLDPEVVSSEYPNTYGGQMPSVLRTADLAKREEMFFPLLAMIGALSEVFVSDNVNTLPNLPKLETEGSYNVATHAEYSAEPVDQYQSVDGHYVAFNEMNGLDFCYKLRVAEDPRPTSDVVNHVHVVTPADDTRQVAYVLALPGVLEQVFSGTAFDAPRSRSGDARVRAVTPGALWKRLECGEAMTTVGHTQPNLEVAAVMAYRGLFDLEQSLEQSRYQAGIQEDLAEFGRIKAWIKTIAGGTAGILKAAGALVGQSEGAEPIAIVKAAISMALFAVGLFVAESGKESAGRAEDMATARYEFVRGLREAMEGYSETLLLQARLADRRGLYQGQP